MPPFKLAMSEHVSASWQQCSHFLNILGSYCLCQIFVSGTDIAPA